MNRSKVSNLILRETRVFDYVVVFGDGCEEILWCEVSDRHPYRVAQCVCGKRCQDATVRRTDTAYRDGS